jgi:hypothetical protein
MSDSVCRLNVRKYKELLSIIELTKVKELINKKYTQTELMNIIHQMEDQVDTLEQNIEDLDDEMVDLQGDGSEDYNTDLMSEFIVEWDLSVKRVNVLTKNILLLTEILKK